MNIGRMKAVAPVLASFSGLLLGVAVSIEAQQGISNSNLERVYAVREVTQKAIIRKRPTPSYTKKAKKHNVEGTVVLKAVFSSGGKVTNIEVVKGLPDGLTEKAIEAAKKIKFDPATIDRRPVSQSITLEYTFNLY
jgi:TonB family protein